MKRWLLALLLIAMLTSLYACEDQMLENADTGAVAGTSIASITDEPAQADAAADTDINKTEFVIYEDRICFIAKSSPEIDAAFGGAVNAVFQSLPETVRDYLMVAPMRIAFEVAELQELSYDQKQEIHDIHMCMDPAVTLVDVYYALSGYDGDLNDIFYRTDHHWTHLGSYYAARAFFEAAKIAYHTIDEYETHDGGPFLGYLQGLAQDAEIDKMPDEMIYYLRPGVNPETWVYYKNVETGELEKTVTTLVDETREGYEMFIGKNGFSHAVIFGEQASDRSLLVLSDSYAFSTTTWLADSFRHVVLVDPRYFEGGKQALDALLAEYGVTDALVMMSAADSAALTEYFADDLSQLTR